MRGEPHFNALLLGEERTGRYAALAGGLAGKTNRLGPGFCSLFDILDDFGIWDRSHGIRVKIPCNTAAVSRPELPR